MGLKRKQVIITRKAQRSIRKIYDFIRHETSKEIAVKVKKAIIGRCKELKDFAGYSEEVYLFGDYRSVTQWDYLIIYSVTDNEVRVLLVIHTSQHPDKRKVVSSNP